MTSEVLFEELKGKDGCLGIITLNRPSALNSLNHSMIQAMYSQLHTWESAEHIKAVVIRSVEGRAFCAGGDIRLTYERMKANNPIMVDFFHEEYQLNRKIYHYPKPYIAFLNGITMGGGVGISIHGSHCVATDNLIFAMPETGIGFFPDVGGTYFLPRISSHLGYYLGLTGEKISGDDCVQMGIANQKVSQESLPKIIDALTHQSLTKDAYAEVSKILETFSVPTTTSALIEQQQEIDKCFSANTMEEILNALQSSESSICKKSVQAILKKSPTSLKVSLKAMQEGKHLNFDTCMRQEYRLVSRFLHGHDFAEGIRAVIIDKDQKPIWKPDSLQAVKNKEVEEYFKPLMKELV